MKHRYFLLMAGTVCAALLSGCAAFDVPVVGKMTPTPTPTIVVTETPTETPIPIITTTPDPETTPVPVSLTPVADEEDYLKTLGEKKEGESVIRVKLVNNTEKDITGVTVIPMILYEDQELRSLLPEGDIFKNKEERVLYYDTQYDERGDDGSAHYNLQIVFADGSSYTMTDVPFSDMKEGSIRAEEPVVYIQYLSVSKRAQQSLLAFEQEAEAARVRAAEEAAREAEYDEDEDGYDPYDDEDDDGGDDGYDAYDEEEEYDTYDDSDYDEE